MSFFDIYCDGAEYGILLADRNSAFTRNDGTFSTTQKRNKEERRW